MTRYCKIKIKIEFVIFNMTCKNANINKNLHKPTHLFKIYSNLFL